MNKNNQTKSALNVSINKEILKEFKSETKKKSINISALFQNFMIEWIKENK